MSNKIYFYELGHRNPVTDHEEIIWFWTQITKPMKAAHATRFWLNIKQTYASVFLRMQAYELLEYINGKVTVEQEQRSIYNKAKTKQKAEKEFQAFLKEREKEKIRQSLISGIHNNLN